MAIIYEGFARGLDALNETIPSPYTMMSTPVGRAYRQTKSYADHFDFYAGAVHYASVGEEELEHMALMDALAAHSSRYEGRVYMGTAGMINLSYVGAMKPAAAIFYDINPLQQVFWTKIIEVLAACPTRAEFNSFLRVAPPLILSMVEDRLGPVRLGINEASMMPRHNPHISSPYRDEDSFLSIHKGDGIWNQDDYYPHLHAMAKAGAMGALTIDVLDKRSWVQLASWLSQQPTQAARKVGMVYISNIFLHLSGKSDWTNRKKKCASQQVARANISQVTDPRGVAVIDELASLSLRWPNDTQPRDESTLRNIWKHCVAPQVQDASPAPQPVERREFALTL